MKFKLREARFDATSSQKYSSAKTAMANANRARSKGATPKLYTSVNFKGGNNLDYGCGAPETVAVVDEYLKSQGVNNYHYDKTYFPDTEVFKDNFYDSVTASNLLSVVPENVREEIIQNTYDVLKPGGKFYVTVNYVKDYVKDETGKKVPSGVAAEMDKDDSYQANLGANKYMEEILKVFDNVNSRKGVLIAEK